MKKTTLAGISMVALLAMGKQANALEFTGGDYDFFPANKNIFLTYYQYAHTDASFSQNNRVAGDNRTASNTLMLRYIHVFNPTKNLNLLPQVILPFGEARGMGDASSLGKVSSMGDVIVGMPFQYDFSGDRTDVFSFGPFIYMPTGNYDHARSLNIGTNRWTFLLQGVWVHHFDEHWALDVGADTSWMTKNDDYTEAHADLENKTRYEYQAYLRYIVDPRTQFSIGGGWIDGNESKVNGSYQNDATNTKYVRIDANHFFTPQWQLEGSLGRDLSVHNGTKNDIYLRLRLGYFF